tara:strand:+ start:114 stop:275 length:162 start_codon:yes stop_codon:yes gene_type:complete
MFKIETRTHKKATIYTILETFKKPNKWGDIDKILVSFTDYKKALQYLENLKTK